MSYDYDRRTAGLDFDYGPQSGHLSTQGGFPPTTECVKCKETAPLALTVSENVKPMSEWMEHRKKQMRSHDISSFAIYICDKCYAASCLWDQA